ncbi:MAG: CBS domain-containing protein [Candidatus Omnitrophica bacterium]|nr:CBS domain-containing protein [Candidatus Omnitrophota bacterium]
MDLITTHINADFDALGSLVAARKLYPDARLLLPGSQERAVREFLSLCKDMIPVEHERGCNLEGIDRLILVDTRHRSRIGIAGKLIDKGVEVHIYDHHPHMKGDIVAEREVYEEVGATITILADIIKKKKIKLSYLEATIMLLGIYEETGSLTYRTTTKLDVDMISFLLSQGANLSVVSRYLNRELSEEELSFLARLINATERTVVNGVSVSMAEVDAGTFVGEMGMLIHKLLDIENIPVLFVFVRTAPGKVSIIARSKLPNVDVNKVLAHFGGGGHATAASAKAHTDDIGELREKLVKILASSIRARICARDIMSQNIKSVNVNDRIEQAKQFLLGENATGMPVMHRGRIVGIATLGDLNKAIRGGYGHGRVKGYMSTNVISIKPTTPLHAIQKIILEKDIGVLPVVKGQKVIGILRRADVLRSVHSGIFTKPRALKKSVVVNLSNKMERMVPQKIMRLLKEIGSLSNSLGYSAFLVGGFVRDLLLEKKNLDLDIVVEGSAIEFGSVLAKRLKGALVVHRQFGTCTVVTEKKLKIDLATARKETYEKPAALPTVEFSSLKNDLIRRDFAINAMAISLNKASFGQLVDFFGGQSDLLRGRIRVMHDLSFIDDPTRIFRAVRFEQRFGFTIDGHTESLIRKAVEERMVDRTQKQRIRDEIILILKEPKPLKAIRRMAELHELEFIHRRIAPEDHTMKLYKGVEEACRWYEALRARKRPVEKWLIYLMALCDDLRYNEMAELCDRFVFRRVDRVKMLFCKQRERKALHVLSRKGQVRPSEAYAALAGLSHEALLLMMAKAAPAARSRIKEFLRTHSLARIAISGDDIKTLGLKPGPVFRKILDLVLRKKIDGRLKTKRAELEYAKKLARRYARRRS